MNIRTCDNALRIWVSTPQNRTTTSPSVCSRAIFAAYLKKYAEIRRNTLSIHRNTQAKTPQAIRRNPQKYPSKNTPSKNPRCDVHRGVLTQMRSALLHVYYRNIFLNFIKPHLPGPLPSNGWGPRGSKIGRKTENLGEARSVDLAVWVLEVGLLDKDKCPRGDECPQEILTTCSAFRALNNIGFSGIKLLIRGKPT